jgi:hypothetical protein
MCFICMGYQGPSSLTEVCCLSLAFGATARIPQNPSDL